VVLAPSLFDADEAGYAFCESLAAAARRGVQVRVLIDDVGARYSRPSIVERLRRDGVTVARFMPTRLPWRARYFNLREHRKLLTIDGRRAFTGGMNIAAANLVSRKPPEAVRDVHFEVEGPVVAQLQEAFTEDWAFAAREELEGGRWFPEPSGDGPVLARAVPDGPDADFDKLRWTIMAALSCARKSVRIVTPYFLPDAPLIDALNMAALSAVRVDLVLPSVGNLALVQWASEAMLWQILKHGCRVFLTPPPFDHTKLIVVDDDWVFLGSANLDPRSLRLNFELNMECYDDTLARQVNTLIDAKLKSARELSLAEVDARSMPVRLRDGLARLLTPYL
jgi:cardiolipin synthase A/B